MRIFTLLLLIFAFTSCDDTSLSTNDTSELDDRNKVALFKIDYQTQVFEGAVELVFEDHEEFTPSINYQPPGDFGGIQIQYEETDAMIFDGTIIWAGLGAIQYPEFEPVENFDRVSPTPTPDLQRFEDIFTQGYQPERDYNELWSSIANLALVREYRAANPESSVYLFLYTPSVGIGDPEEFDWIVMLKN